MNSITAAKHALNNIKCSGLLIADNFNYPYIEWYSDGYNGAFGNEDSPGNQFIDMLNDKSLFQAVHFLTFRKGEGTMSNTLYYIITESPHRVTSLIDTLPLGCATPAHVTLSWNYEVSCDPIQKILQSQIHV
jgi:hypothetical protein